MTVDWLDSPAVVAAVAGLFGLLIGSFLNVVIHRLPRMIERGNVTGVVDWFDDLDEYVDRVAALPDGAKRAALKEQLRAVEPAFTRLAHAIPDENLVRPGSRCGACGHRIGPFENVPVLSWLWLRGRCKACKARISARYPAIELLTGVLFAAAGWRFGFEPATLAALVLIGGLVALTFIDADAMLLPDAITLPLLWAGLLWSAFGGFVPLVDSVFGAVAGYLSLWSVFWLYKLATGKEGFGYGDFKLLAALGAWFGWQAILPIVLMSAVVGAVVGITLIVTGRKTMASRLPFGVYLAPAGLLMLFAGRLVIEAILPTIGLTAGSAPVLMRYTVGLTGGIGSGKSTVADRFAAHGVAIVDADVAAHRLTAPGGAAIDAIRSAFGASFIEASGALDRAAMRRHVFADGGERVRLEAILHPMIRAACDAEVEAARSPYAMLVVPLLFESNRRAGTVRRTLVIACDEAIQIARVMKRSGLAEAEVRAIIATQMPAAERIARADDVIDNSGDAEALVVPVARLHAIYLAEAARTTG